MRHQGSPMAPKPPSLLPLLLLFSLLTSSQPTLEPNEKQILLNLKSEWGNPPSLSSWNTSVFHCQWPGILCSGSSVTAISLPGSNITRPIPAAICSLGNLSHIDLSFNYIPGPFPSVLYNCSSLKHLDISQNLLVGRIPADIDTMPRKLVRLILSANNFTGDIPPAIGRLPAIEWLHLDYNLFNGTIPPEMSNLSTLESLWLAGNPFPPATSIHPEFGNLTSLTFLWMANMNLAGDIPGTLGDLAKLKHLDLAMNSLGGAIPEGIWMLKQLKKLYLYKNNLTGEISESIGAADGLVEIDVSTNQLTGSIPETIGQLKNLSILFLYFNQLSGDIPASIDRLPELTDLRLFNNRLGGSLPPELGRHSKLVNLEVDDNLISGELPEHLCDGKALTSLIVFDNRLTGKIPESLGSCYTLSNLQIHNNSFSGEFPTRIWWAAANLTVLIARQNSLTGALPDKLPRNMTLLDIRNNQFFGRIPSSAGDLRVFYGDDNTFSGELPASFSRVSLLQVLSLSSNRISGKIPAAIGYLRFLNQLNLRGNLLYGAIPETIGFMPVLNGLDLSENDLSGDIPSTLGGLKLNYLNLSSNELIGEIPIQLQNQAYDQSFLSNPGLCGSLSLNKLSSCRSQSNSRFKISNSLLFLFLTLGSFLFVAVTVLSAFLYREHRPQNNAAGSDWFNWKLNNFHALDFTESSIARGLTPENLIGSGGGGMVYRVELQRETVAVKKIWNSRKLDAKLEKEFNAEVEILGSIRHSNIVKLLCSISGTDCKLLVYEYLENRSLDCWLHRHRRGLSGMLLNWPTRLKIAIGAARGLRYMHHDCFPTIIHRDMKSSNILLDKDFNAKIADFGLAQVLARGGEPETAPSAIAGSFGYMAPECAALRKVNEKVDVYSFGVVLLELATGRQAWDGGEEEGNLADWAWRKYKERGEELAEVVGESPEFLVEAEVVFTLGLICTALEPASRPTMKEVLQILMRLERGSSEGGDDGGAGLVRNLKRKMSCKNRRIDEVVVGGDDTVVALCATSRDSLV